MKSIFVTTTLVISLFIAPASYAQSTESTDSEMVPPTIDVQPAGLARQEWEVVRDLVLSVPNPAGPALPGLVDGEFGPSIAGASLTLDGSFQRFTYTCGTSRCTGFATEIWRSLPRGTQQAYIDSIMDALIANFSDRPRYTVWIEGQDSKGYLGARGDWAGSGTRRYRFIGP